MDRTANRWEVRVQNGETGQEQQVIVAAHWDPEHLLTQESVQFAGAMQAWVKSGPSPERRKPFQALSAKLVGA